MTKKFLYIIMAVLMIFSSVQVFATESGAGNPNAISGSLLLNNEYPKQGDKVELTINIVNNTDTQIEISDVVLTVGAQAVSFLQTAIAPKATENKKYEFTYDGNVTAISLSIKETIIATAATKQEVKYETKDVISSYKSLNETNYIYSVSGKITNTGNIIATDTKISAKIGENVVSDVTAVETIAINESADFTADVNIPKTDFTGDALIIKLIAESGTYKNEFDISLNTEVVLNISDLLISEVIPANGEKEDSTSLKFSVTGNLTNAGNKNAQNIKVNVRNGDNSYGEYILSDVILQPLEVKDFSFEITVAKADFSGSICKASIQLSANTDYINTKQIELKRNLLAGELENIKFYYMENDTKTFINTDPAFNSGIYTYRLDIEPNVSTFGIEFPETSPETINNIVITHTMKIGDLFGSLVEKSNYGAIPAKGYLINVKINNEISYTIYINKKLTLTPIPNPLTIYTGQSADLNVTRYYSNAHEDKDVSSIYVQDKDGNKLGTVTLDNVDNKRYWAYTSPAENIDGIPVEFVFVDPNGGKTVQQVILKTVNDVNVPKWTDGPFVSGISTSSADIRWLVATDNDQIKEYRVYCYKYYPEDNPPIIVTAGKSYSTQAKVNGLSSNTDYQVVIESIDRTGNKTKSPVVKFSTLRSSSSSGNGSSGGSSGSVVTPTPTPEPAKGNFTDMSLFEWAQKEVEYLAKQDIIKGVSEDLFEPGSNITRADYILLLVRALKLTGNVTENFDDVNEDDYYYNAIGIAKQRGLINGNGNNLFAPNDNISRQDMIVMTYRALEQVGILTAAKDKAVYGDDSQIADYAKAAVYALAEKGIIKGDQNGNINPESLTIRAEAAVIICRILNI